MLTTTEAAALLSERGIRVKPDTIKHWCKQGKFPGAHVIGGRVWQIPQEDVETLTPPRGRGRPKRNNDSAA